MSSTRPGLIVPASHRGVPSHGSTHPPDPGGSASHCSIRDRGSDRDHRNDGVRRRSCDTDVIRRGVRDAVLTSDLIVDRGTVDGDRARDRGADGGGAVGVRTMGPRRRRRDDRRATAGPPPDGEVHHRIHGEVLHRQCRPGRAREGLPVHHSPRAHGDRQRGSPRRRPDPDRQWRLRPGRPRGDERRDPGSRLRPHGRQRGPRQGHRVASGSARRDRSPRSADRGPGNPADRRAGDRRRPPVGPGHRRRTTADADRGQRQPDRLPDHAGCRRRTGDRRLAAEVRGGPGPSRRHDDRGGLEARGHLDYRCLRNDPGQRHRPSGRNGAVHRDPPGHRSGVVRAHPADRGAGAPGRHDRCGAPRAESPRRPPFGSHDRGPSPGSPCSPRRR